MNIEQSLSTLCPPAMLYLVLSLVSTLGMVVNSFSLLSILFKVVFVLMWTWILNFICLKGYGMVSWFLVLFPFIMVFLFMFMMLDVMAMSGITDMASPYMSVPNYNMMMPTNGSTPHYHSSTPHYHHENFQNEDFE